MALSVFLPPPGDRFFEDYVVGTVFEFGPIAVTEPEIIAFARQFDPQIMHVDPEKAAQGAYGGLIASGWHTIGLMMRMFVDNYTSTIAGLASPGVDELRWYRPVRPGDELMLRVSILTARLSRTKPDRGLVTALVEAINQEGIVVCGLKVMNLVRVRPVPAH